MIAFPGATEVRTRCVNCGSAQERMTTRAGGLERMKSTALVCVLLSWPVLTSTAFAAQSPPDLSGTYDIATLTPLQRPEFYGDKLYLSPDEAKQIEQNITF